MDTRQNTKKGYMTLEAAIFLPIFVIAVVTIGYFIKVIGIDENMIHSAVDEANHLASQAYAVKVAPGFAHTLEERLQDENKEADDIDVKNFLYLYRNIENDGLISFTFTGRARLNLPLDFRDNYGLENRLKCRGFIGKKNKGEPMPFDEMEREGSSKIVWIFPMSGQRYHGEFCTYVKTNVAQRVLNQKIMRDYVPCHLCKPQDLLMGTFIYCFLSTGEAYHKGSCKTIDKYTVEIEREDALKRGYTPCNKCKGG